MSVISAARVHNTGREPITWTVTPAPAIDDTWQVSYDNGKTWHDLTIAVGGLVTAWVAGVGADPVGAPTNTAVLNRGTYRPILRDHDAPGIYVRPTPGALVIY